jgi:hypothetical protein
MNCKWSEQLPERFMYTQKEAHIDSTISKQ